jgi:superfamily II DNA helicase RecQ
MTSEELVSIVALKQKIGFEVGVQAHQWQLDAMEVTLDGLDGIVIAPTGSGKSLVFQGLSLASSKGVVLVVCPLKALMCLQVFLLTWLD